MLSRTSISRRAALGGLASAILVNSQPVADPLIVVTSRETGELSIASTRSFEVLERVRVGDGPHEVALSKDRSTAFVANYAKTSGGKMQKPGNTISVVDLAERKETGRIELGALIMPHGLAVHGDLLYFTAEQQRIVARYNILERRIDWMMGTGAAAGHMVVVAPDGRRVFVGAISDNVVAAVDAGPVPGPNKVKRIPVGKAPEGIGISSDGKTVWAAHRGDGGVSVIDTASDAVVATIPEVGKLPYRVAATPDGTRILVTDPVGAQVVVLDARERKVMQRVNTGEGTAPQGITVSPDSRRAYVAGETKVMEIDLEKYQAGRWFTVGAGADGIAVTG